MNIHLKIWNAQFRIHIQSRLSSMICINSPNPTIRVLGIAVTTAYMTIASIECRGWKLIPHRFGSYMGLANKWSRSIIMADNINSQAVFHRSGNNSLAVVPGTMICRPKCKIGRNISGFGWIKGFAFDHITYNLFFQIFRKVKTAVNNRSSDF